MLKFKDNDGDSFFLFEDLFTRGIDIQAVNVVINFDFPKQIHSRWVQVHNKHMSSTTLVYVYGFFFFPLKWLCFVF